MESLEEPKFKIGDKIRHKKSGLSAIVKEIVDGEYILTESTGTHLPIIWQNSWERLSESDSQYERIRQALYLFVETYGDYCHFDATREEMLAWVEDCKIDTSSDFEEEVRKAYEECAKEFGFDWNKFGKHFVSWQKQKDKKEIDELKRKLKVKKEEPIGKDFSELIEKEYSKLPYVDRMSPSMFDNIKNLATNIAKWKKQQTIDKVCEFLDGGIYDYIEMTHANVDTYLNVDDKKLIEDLKREVK